MSSIRPTTLLEFTGQPQLSRDLGVLLQAAAGRGECPDHIILAGPPGLGKTTLAGIIATELGMPLVSTSAPAIGKPGDLLALLTGLSQPSVVFVDEIHALERRAEEMLYTAMEDGHVDVVIGEGPSSRSVRLKLAPFTLVGATTQMGQISAPLRGRFGFHGRLQPYTPEDLSNIVKRSATVLGINIEDGAASLIAARSQGTPRIANRWLRRVRDWAEVHQHPDITGAVAKTALEEFGIDELGLDPLGRDILQTMIAHFKGGPVGLNTLAAAVGESENTISDVYEPHLLRQGLIQRTPRGRVVTERGWAHLGLEASSVTALLTLYPESESGSSGQ